MPTQHRYRQQINFSIRSKEKFLKCEFTCMALGDNCTDTNWSTKGYSIPQVNVTKHMPRVELFQYICIYICV